MRHHIHHLIFILLTISLHTFAQQPIASQKDQDTKAKSQQATEYYNARDYKNAADIFGDLYKDHPNQTNYIYLFNSLIGLKDFKQAERIVKKQIKAFPADPRYQVDLGYIYLSAQNKHKGQKQYDKIIKEMPANESMIRNIASAFRSRNEINYALNTYQQGRILLNKPWAFALSMGQIYGQAGEYDRMYNSYLTELEHEDRYFNSIKYNLQKSFLDDPNQTKRTLFKTKLLKKIQKDPENRIFSELMIWYSIQEKDFEMALNQSIAIDKRYKENGTDIYNLSQISLSNQNYDVAIEALEYLIKKGEGGLLYYPAQNQLLITEYIKLSNTSADQKQWLALEARYISNLEELGYGVQTFELMRYLGQLQAYQLKNYPAAIATMEKGLSIRGINLPKLSQLKIELGDIYLYAGDPWEAILLYAQVHKILKNDPIGHEAKFRHAKVSFYIGEFEWAKAQLDILKAATTKLIANDALELSLTIQNNLGMDSTNTALKIYARADMAIFMNKYDQALQILDTLENMQAYHELKDDALFLKAKTHISLGHYTVADSLLKTIHTDYSFDLLADNALYLRAELNENHLQNMPKALELYLQLMTEIPGSIYAEEARKRYRQIKSGTEIEPAH
ncbi:MAG: tetratricopeptide repeat protein [Bacteroidales bacterium]|nr:tetratricopeptide repeat protein [Bacteroidales bacterium]